MKRRFLSALVIVGALFLTACQEDDTMDELIQDTSATAFDQNASDGAGGNGGSGAGSGGVGGN